MAIVFPPSIRKIPRKHLPQTLDLHPQGSQGHRRFV